jgi:hypothetical protein
VEIYAQCRACKHLDRTAPRAEWRCTAYPFWTRLAVLLDMHDHCKPFPDDRGYGFGAIDPAEERTQMPARPEGH